MRLILGIISLVFCTYFGYYLSRKYTVKKEFYSDFYEFNKFLKNDISFVQNSLLSIINKFENKKSLFHTNLKRHIIDKNHIDIDKNIFLNEEIEFFQNYIENLGASDKQSQLSFLNNVESQLKDYRELTSADEKKYKSLYIKMGFLIGLIALIILI